MARKYHYKESDLQIQCVKWFGYEYPHLRMLLFHPKNEGSASGRAARVQGAIAKAEGVVAGVSDLLLLVPSENGYSCLAVEMKTPTGRQSKEQKLFQQYITAADGKYVICRSFDDFQAVVTRYVAGIWPDTINALKALYRGQQQAEEDLARQQLKKLVGTK